MIAISLPTTLRDSCSEIDYFTLNDASRNVNYGKDNYLFCDVFGYDATSPDWHGPNWYRIAGPAGTMITETITEKYHCNTYRTTWLNGVHPTMQDETVTRTICINVDGITCDKEVHIQIRNCGSYFLYNLPDVPNHYYARYCTE